jgi:hypothetical protein
MKTLNFKKTSDILVEFALTSTEMIKVRGGSSELDPTIMITPPPVKI